MYEQLHNFRLTLYSIANTKGGGTDLFIHSNAIRSPRAQSKAPGLLSAQTALYENRVSDKNITD